jgi:uncharacterized membrane protein
MLKEYIYKFQNFGQIKYVSIEAKTKKDADRILKSRIGRGKITPDAWQRQIDVEERAE